MSGPTADVASVVIDRPAEVVFDFMADPHRLDMWSFGTWQVEVDQDGLITGTAIYDGSHTFVRIEADRDRLLIDYAIGTAPDMLTPRIFVRVSPGATLGIDSGHAMLSIVALRGAAMDDARWERLTTAHAFEVNLIKSILESGFDHRTLR